MASPCWMGGGVPSPPPRSLWGGSPRGSFGVKPAISPKGPMQLLILRGADWRNPPSPPPQRGGGWGGEIPIPPIERWGAHPTGWVGGGDLPYFRDHHGEGWPLQGNRGELSFIPQSLLGGYSRLPFPPPNPTPNPGGRKGGGPVRLPRWGRGARSSWKCKARGAGKGRGGHFRGNGGGSMGRKRAFRAAFIYFLILL